VHALDSRQLRLSSLGASLSSAFIFGKFWYALLMGNALPGPQQDLVGIAAI